MKRYRTWIALLSVSILYDVAIEAQADARRASTVTVRPATLAATIDELAGFHVRVPYARVVGVFNPRVLVVDTATALPPVVGHRHRLLVLIEGGSLNVPGTLIVGSTVTISGVARTLVGVQVTRDVPWPPEITPDLAKRLEIRGAVLAQSVDTAEGVPLTSAETAQP